MPPRDLEMSRGPGPRALPLVVVEPGERADAARNRRLILTAAERLIAERGVAAVSMEAIASEAGVGKGTVFRRFGDRSNLLHALLDSREREFQEAIIRGEPPLGPGAPAAERLIAFGRRLVAHLEAHGELLLGAETGARGIRFRAPVYTFYRAHVEMLVREAAPGVDSAYLAEALLAPLAADLFLYLRTVRGLPVERIADGYAQLVRGLLAGT